MWHTHTHTKKTKKTHKRTNKHTNVFIVRSTLQSCHSSHTIIYEYVCYMHICIHVYHDTHVYMYTYMDVKIYTCIHALFYACMDAWMCSCRVQYSRVLPFASRTVLRISISASICKYIYIWSILDNIVQIPQGAILQSAAIRHGRTVLLGGDFLDC